MLTSDHCLYSRSREMLVEHLFIGEVLRTLWQRGWHEVEVLKPQVDDAGYDVAIQCGSVLRHIQMKSAYDGASTGEVKVHTRLAGKPSGCVIWIVFNEQTLDLRRFLWFGGQAGQPLPSLEGLRVARHSKGDSTGYKAERPHLRVIPRSRFEVFKDVRDVVTRLFGPPGVLPDSQ